ncbi:hypothetical protein [Runella sp. SP2]|uniref:hypothetical protein n=1 Tax=Runella sp. SP2 TaxID=2268026 RepID=UPI000F08ADB2|nr:hypothetical protein [Runella sp. SP2]AYQ30959.1 hypothetical protein DTQ70_01645 [Runella sp. SP2]
MLNELDSALQVHDENHDHNSTVAIGKVKKLCLKPSDFLGGIAIWGALNPVYNTYGGGQEEGVHVHARREIGGKKEIDETFDIVQVPYENESGAELLFEITGSDASNYNVSTIFKKNLTFLPCPNCNKIHSDKGWFAVHPHSIHRCEHCDHIFTSDFKSISNPIMMLKKLCGDTLQERIVIDPVERIMFAKQANFKGGIQIWGSNPAILWTSPKFEEGGIHFHGFRKINSHIPEADETFGKVKVDGIYLDPEMVRHLMAQYGLEYLKGRIQSINCPSCTHDHFDTFDDAVNPHSIHCCENCGSLFLSKLPIVSNPLVRTFKGLNQMYNQLNKKEV